MYRQIYRASQNLSLETIKMPFMRGGKFEKAYFDLDIKLCSKCTTGHSNAFF